MGTTAESAVVMGVGGIGGGGGGGGGGITGVVESGAGSIVWVRRRNGSWWPGKILGPDELAASHLMSPRSGTPVKLLGREDASVDWYNLEKSKRVKAFRCGEFDDCIEKAEASQGLPAKKREKYARREDAILHALELERLYFEKKYGKIRWPNPVRENSMDPEKKKVVASPVALENGNGKLGNHEVCQLDKKAKLPNTMERGNFPLRAHKAKDTTLLSLEEQSSEVSPETEGLRDFGIMAVPISRMLYTSGASEDSNRTAIDGHTYTVSGTYPCFENSSDSDSRNSVGRGKRLLQGYVEEPLPKRQDRNNALVKMRQNSLELPDRSVPADMYAKMLPRDGVQCSLYMPAESEILNTKLLQGHMDLPVSQLEAGTHHPHRGTYTGEAVSGSSEETESDSSETHSLEPHVETRMLLSDAETRIRLEMQAGQESTSCDESDELSFDERSQFHFHDPNNSTVGVSKWQLKGKRNVRNMIKRPIDRVTYGAYLEARGRSLNQRAASLGYYHDNGYTNDANYIEDDSDHQTHGLGNRRYLASQAVARRQNYVGRNMGDWEELAWGRSFRGYWEERGCFNQMFAGRDMLIEVDVKVQANRQGEHVPWVSLMSKLNGKAIIGHPIQIETLEDGSAEDIISTSDMLAYDSDRSRVPPVWSTARRTANFRVPRPHRSSQLGDDDEDIDYKHLHHSGKIRYKKSPMSISVRKGSLSKKTHSHVSRSPQGTKKPSRKVNLSSNQKTKALSSITFDQKFANATRNNDTSYYMDSAIKPVDSGPPTVACIPVKLVFSRLLEAVGRPPSGTAKLGVSVNSNKETNPC